MADPQKVPNGYRIQVERVRGERAAFWAVLLPISGRNGFLWQGKEYDRASKAIADAIRHAKESHDG